MPVSSPEPSPKSRDRDIRPAHPALIPATVVVSTRGHLVAPARHNGASRLSKLTKSEAHPFTGHQPKLSSTDRRTIPSQEDVIDLLPDARTRELEPDGGARLDWRDIDIDALTPTDVDVVETALLVESNNPDYVADLLDYFKADQDVCDFLMMWGIEEWKHYYALRDYMTKVQSCHSRRRQARPTVMRDPTARRDRGIGRGCARRRCDGRPRDERDELGHPAPLHAGAGRREHDVPGVRHRGLLPEPRAPHERARAREDRDRSSRRTRPATRCSTNSAPRTASTADPDAMPLVIDALKEFGMPGAYLLDDYDERRAAMEAAAFPTLADKQGCVRAPLQQDGAPRRPRQRHARLHRRQLPLGRRRRPHEEEDAPGDDHPPADAAPRLITPSRRSRHPAAA